MAITTPVRIKIAPRPVVRLRVVRSKTRFRVLPKIIPADGEAATIEVGTVTTLPAGSPATVTNVGTSGAAVFDFAIPEGGAGTPGDDGLVQSVVAGIGVTVDNTDPANPVINATGAVSSVDGATGAVTIGAVIAAATGKTTPVDADTLALSDSAASNATKKVTWANVKATLKAYFDPLYQPLVTALTSWGAITRAAGFDTFVATPSSANLRTLLTDETGTGAAVFAGSPALTGAPTAPTASAMTSTTQIASTAFVTGATREKLSANRTYYVRTDGSDSNNGLANTSGGAFLTLQKAYDTIAANLDLGGYTITVQVGAGTYTAGVSITQPWSGGGAVTFLGDSSTPGNVIISATAARCFYWNCNLPGMLTVQGFKVQTTTSGDAVRGDGAGTCTMRDMEYGACAGRQLLLATPGANLLFGGTYLISGGAQSHWVAESLSRLRCDGKTITITGTPAFSNAFAQAQFGGILQVGGNTFSGSATGRRYNIASAGGVHTSGGGATYLPGNSSPADIVTTPGWYV